MADLPDHRSRIILKIMQMLDCSPGNLRTADGPPVVILRLAHGDQIEEPMMLSLFDAQQLMTRLLISLEHHGDEFAAELLQGHFVTTDISEEPSASDHSVVDPDPLISRNGRGVAYGARNPKYFPIDRPRPSSAAPSSTARVRPQVPAKPWTRRLTKEPASLCKFVVRYGRNYRPRNSLFALGGYSDGVSHFVLARRRASNGTCEDGVAQILPPYDIDLWGDTSGDRLPDDQWESFLNLRKGKTFQMNGKTWTKMTHEALAALTHGKTFKCMPRKESH